MFVFGINLGDIPVLNHSQNKLKFMQTYWPYGLYLGVLVKIYIAHYVSKNYISGKKTKISATPALNILPANRDFIVIYCVNPKKKNH